MMSIVVPCQSSIVPNSLENADFCSVMIWLVVSAVSYPIQYFIKGYKEDACSQGYFHLPAHSPPRYSLQYWHHIDLFVYFSHFRVSPPPPLWTTAAHRNGVLVLGTLITELEEGTRDNERLIFGPTGKPISDSPNQQWSTYYADKLIALAIENMFDGWFVNIESPCLPTHQFALFLDYFTRKSHEHDLVVMWYDSLTEDGEIDWQNGLTTKSKLFFDATDGIFTNYTWKPRDVINSSHLASQRRWDVFTGIDVWGRNTFGGGGFDTYKALDVISRVGTSIALFAPAWTYETFQCITKSINERADSLTVSAMQSPQSSVKPPTSNSDSEKATEETITHQHSAALCPILGQETWLDSDLRFWCGNGHVEGEESRGVASYVNDLERPEISSGVFGSSFNSGWGNEFYWGGKVEGASAFHFLS